MSAPAASEEFRSEETPIRRGSPLPWLLLLVTVFVAVGIFWMARARLGEEKLRTANALKANDEVHARLKSAVGEMEDAQLKSQQAQNKTTELEAKVKDLESQNQALTDELDKLKKKGPKR